MPGRPRYVGISTSSPIFIEKCAIRGWADIRFLLGLVESLGTPFILVPRTRVELPSAAVYPIVQNLWDHEAVRLFADDAKPRDGIQSIEHERSELGAVRDGQGPTECDEPLGLLFRLHWCHPRAPCPDSD